MRHLLFAITLLCILRSHAQTSSQARTISPDQPSPTLHLALSDPAPSGQSSSARQLTSSDPTHSGQSSSSRQLTSLNPAPSTQQTPSLARSVPSTSSRQLASSDLASYPRQSSLRPIPFFSPQQYSRELTRYSIPGKSSSRKVPPVLNQPSPRKVLSISARSSSPRQAPPRSGPNSIAPVGVIKGLSDSALLDVIQRQTFRYFWHYAHPISGLARERDNTVRAEYYWDYINEADDQPNFSRHTFGEEACAIGGTGFGILSTIVAVNRGWIGRDTALRRLVKIVDFLIKADCYHGIYPHFMNGATGKTIPFGRLDDGADIVETSYLFMGLLCAKEYFKGDTPLERYFRDRVNQMWTVADWNWHSHGGDKLLYWHWSPYNDFDMNFPVYGWDEALITYIMSASSPTHPISKELYENCWVKSQSWRNGKSYYGITLPLGNFEWGGPLFFEQYTFMGIDPNGLKDDQGIDYAEQTRNHTLINRAYCIDNPKKYKGYGPDCWGLTAGDSYKGYVAHCPQDDRGVIQPTAALSSFPYTPEYSMQALKHFYYGLGSRIWGPYGFADGFSESRNWYAKTHLAIDEGPIVVMIENYRSALIWRLFMNIPDVQNGLKKLGFQSPYLK